MASANSVDDPGGRSLSMKIVEVVTWILLINYKIDCGFHAEQTIAVNAFTVALNDKNLGRIVQSSDCLSLVLIANCTLPVQGPCGSWRSYSTSPAASPHTRVGNHSCLQNPFTGLKRDTIDIN